MRLSHKRNRTRRFDGGLFVFVRQTQIKPRAIHHWIPFTLTSLASRLIEMSIVLQRSKRLNNEKIIAITLTVMVLSAVAVISPGCIEKSSIEKSSVANVLVYVGPGSWSNSTRDFEYFCTYKGLTYQEQSYNYINSNDLRGKFNVIYFPGGNADPYDEHINSDGDVNIRDFVSNGGGYLGICAGAYFACDRILFDGGWENYKLDLFAGYGYGALDPIIPWPGHAMTWTTMNLTNPLCQWEPTKEYQLYYGGPAFYPDAGQSMNVIATWDSYYNSPAMINYSYGSGHVVLCGPHPEIEEGGTHDGWNILWTSLDYLMNVPITQPPGMLTLLATPHQPLT
jgi:glutamine amidotransferase-like uncharacterized protein